MTRLRPYLSLLTLSVITSGCFYDHRITQAILERRKRAKEAEGAKIRAAAPSAARPRHTGEVKFFVADAYRAQHKTWQRDLEDLVDQSNAVLGPQFGVQLEVSAVNAWSPACDPTKGLTGCLDELSKIDAGEGGTWVVGVLGSEPKSITRFDELGMARALGPHFILRDVSDIAERAAIDRAFSTFTQSRRDEIYKKRKQHKRLAVFLHEWAHTLGGLHTRDQTDLLNPSYDDEMKSYGADNLSVLGAAIEDAFSHNLRYSGLLAHLEKTATPDLDAEERAELLAQLTRLREEPAAKAVAEAEEAEESDEPEHSHPYVVKGSDQELLEGLTEKDRASYHRAVDAVWDDPAGSLTELTALATHFPENYAIQHLRCGLAMHLGQMEDAQSACNLLPKLKGNVAQGAKTSPTVAP